MLRYFQKQNHYGWTEWTEVFSRPQEKFLCGFKEQISSTSHSCWNSKEKIYHHDAPKINMDAVLIALHDEKFIDLDTIKNIHPTTKR